MKNLASILIAMALSNIGSTDFRGSSKALIIKEVDNGKPTKRRAKVKASRKANLARLKKSK